MHIVSSLIRQKGTEEEHERALLLLSRAMVRMSSEALPRLLAEQGRIFASQVCTECGIGQKHSELTLNGRIW